MSTAHNARATAWRYLALLPFLLAVIAAWWSSTPADGGGAAAQAQASPAGAAEPVTPPRHTALLLQYPAPQVDESAPPEEAPPTF
jgi:hypothetical protein